MEVYNTKIDMPKDVVDKVAEKWYRSRNPNRLGGVDSSYPQCIKEINVELFKMGYQIVKV